MSYLLSPPICPMLRLRTRQLDFPPWRPEHDCPLQPPQHKMIKKWCLLMKWAFSYSLLATATVTLLVGPGDKMASALLLFTSVGRRGEDETFTSEKNSPACTSVAAAVVPLHVSLMFCVLFFCHRHLLSMCSREFKRERGFIELSRSCIRSSNITSFQPLEAAWLSHASQVLCMNLQY